MGSTGIELFGKNELPLHSLFTSNGGSHLENVDVTTLGKSCLDFPALSSMFPLPLSESQIGNKSLDCLPSCKNQANALISECVALTKQGDTALSNVCPSVAQSVCMHSPV